jgi:diaminopimelate epimerase
MKLPFTKMEGLGNCYIFAEARNDISRILPKLARAISDAGTGVGADGLIVVDTRKEPFIMRIFNSDGSEAELCGNGLRQAALFIRKTKFGKRRDFAIATKAGRFATEIISTKANTAIVRTALGAPDFAAKAVGIEAAGLGLNLKSPVKSTKFKTIDCVNVGNPHAVVWVNDYDFDWKSMGQALSTDPYFTRGINVHFCRVINPRRFEMKIYERGSGVTRACGSGAASCLAAGVMRNLLQKSATAVMPGGNLKLSWNLTSGEITQTGPVSIVCSGEYYY